MATRILLLALWFVVKCDSDNCDMSCNVSLSSREEFCPSQPVTVQCNVTKPQDGDFLLSWRCTDSQKMNTERLVFCNTGPVSELNCQFGKVNNVFGDCICNGTVISSKATFSTTSMCNMVLSCSSGGGDSKQVSVTINGLNAPVLSENYTVKSTFDNGTFEVMVWWTKGDCAPDDVEYNLTINDTSYGSLSKVTNQTQMILLLNQSIEYALTVTAQLCDGDLMSESSNTIFIASTPTTATPATTSTPTTSTPAITNFPSVTSRPTESSESAAIIAGITVPAILVVVVILILLCGVWVFRKKIAMLWKRLKGREDEVDFPPLLKRSGIAGLYVDDKHIYYSCTEVSEKTNEKKYKLRKCTYSGRLVKEFHCNSFVRGIGQSRDFLYVLNSKADSQVVKLDKHFKSVKGTSDECGKDFGEAFAMLVTSDNVLVCSERFSQICVLDLNLEFLYNLKLNDFRPIGIAKFKNHFIILDRAAVSVIDIDFERRLKRDIITFKEMKKDESVVPFGTLRGICCSEEFIYVTQTLRDDPGLPILCLQFDEEKKELNYVCEVNNFSANCDECNDKCCPVIPFYHNDTIFYSQGSYGERFHIVQATHTPEGPIASTKLFDLI